MYKAILVIILVAVSARAEFINLPSESTAIVDNQMTFAPFDSGLGTLTGVNLQLSVTLSSLYTFAVLPGTPTWANTQVWLSGMIGFMGTTAGGQTINAGATVQDTDFAPTTLELRSLLSTSRFWSSNLGGFAGVDPWALTMYTDIQYYFRDIPSTVYQSGGTGLLFSDARANLLYEYTPVEPVLLTHHPEPGFFLVVGLALAGLVVVRRRQLRS